MSHVLLLEMGRWSRNKCILSLALVTSHQRGSHWAVHIYHIDKIVVGETGTWLCTAYLMHAWDVLFLPLCEWLCK